MVLQAATNSRQMSDNRQGQPPQVVCVADPGKQQDLRRIDRSCSKNDLLAELHRGISLTKPDFGLHGPAA